MSTVTPPPPPVSTAPIAGLVNTAAVVLSAPPQTLQALQALQAGQSLQAVMTSMPAANQIQVQTTLGILTLQTSLTVPRGAVLTLTAVSAPASAANGMPGPIPQTSGSPAALSAAAQDRAPLSLQITAINGKPLAGAGQMGANLTTAGQATATQSPATPLSIGQTVTATLLRPAQGLPSPGASQAASQGGGQGASQANPAAAGNAARPMAAGPSSAPVGPGPTPTGNAATGSAGASRQTGAPTTSAPASSVPTSQTSTTLASTTQASMTLATGTRFSITVQRIEAPGAAVTTSTSTTSGAKTLATGQVLTGVVTGRTVGGQPIVQTPAATFALGNAARLADGTQVTFRLESAPLAPSAASTGAAALHGPGTLHERITAKTWDDLGDALKALAGSDPARLAQVAQTALPQPGAKLTSQMLFFLSALKGGDLKGLFGDTTLRILDKERPGLTTRMSADFQAMARLADEPQSGDWRLALIPLWSGEKLEQVRFFWRGGNGAADEGEAPEETRFVFDLDLSNLGHMQIDGLVKAKRHHLDLIIRTEQPLPADMRATIADIFESARESLSLGGQVAFQAAPGNFVVVPASQPGTNGIDPHPGLLA